MEYIWVWCFSYSTGAYCKVLTILSKPAIIIALEQEIEFAKTCLQPHDTGHIHTAINWMEARVAILRQELSDQLSSIDNTNS